MKHSKKYSEQQDAVRLVHFEKTNAQVEAHNAKFQKGLVTYKMEHNVFNYMVRA